jgi:molybdenum cofactor cytidylyltransferase
MRSALISAVVLAAGLSERMGKSKLALRVEGRPVLEAVLDALRGSEVDEVVVVLGADADVIRKVVRFHEELVVVNARPERGMSSSLKLGLGRVSPRADAALIVLGDQPFLNPEVINRVVEGYDDRSAPIVVPVYRGIRGNPVLFARSVFPEVMKVTGDTGAKSVVNALGDRVLEVQFEDDAASFDIDTPADYERATSRRARKRTQEGA